MVLEAAMSMKLHRIGTVTPWTHDLLVKTPWVRSLLTMSRTSERTVSSKASWLPNHTFTHFFTNSRSRRKAFPDSFTRSCSQTSGAIERDHLQLLLGSTFSRCLQICRQWPGRARKSQKQEGHRPWLRHWEIPKKGQRKHHRRRSDEHCNGNRPEKDWSDDQFLFRHWAFLLFKKAASSNKHHIRSVQVGSQRMSIKSDFFSSPAKLKMAWVFSVKSFSWIQILSKNTRSWGRQNSIATEVARKPKHSDQRAWPTPLDSIRYQAGRSAKPKRNIIRTATRLPEITAAAPL